MKKKEHREINKDFLPNETLDNIEHDYDLNAWQDFFNDHEDNIIREFLQ